MRGLPLSDVSKHLDMRDALVWVDLVQPADDLAELADELGLHELAVEDAPGAARALEDRPLHPPVRLDCAIAALRPNARMQLDTSEVDAFVGDRWVVTVQASGGYDIDVLRPLGRNPRPGGHRARRAELPRCSTTSSTATSTPSGSSTPTTTR